MPPSCGITVGRGTGAPKCINCGCGCGDEISGEVLRGTGDGGECVLVWG